MKSENKAPINMTGPVTGVKGDSNDYSNEMNSGTIGAEGSNDNGASTLRVMKKQLASKPSSKRPLL
jgi:hypothetical protein